MVCLYCKSKDILSTPFGYGWVVICNKCGRVIYNGEEKPWLLNLLGGGMKIFRFITVGIGLLIMQISLPFHWAACGIAWFGECIINAGIGEDQ